MDKISDLQCGKAGEYLVCADLILSGRVAFPSEQGLSFDVVVEVGGRLAKIQVKTTRTVRKVPQREDRHSAYLFHVKRMGKGSRGRYSIGTVDIFALVALDSREIGYLAAKDVKQTMLFRSPFLEGTYHDEKHAERNARIVELREGGMSFRQIGRELGMDASFVHEIYSGKAGGGRKHRYLRDCSFADAAREAGLHDPTVLPD